MAGMAAVTVIIVIGILVLTGVLLLAFIARLVSNFLRQARQAIPPAMLDQLQQAIQNGDLNPDHQEPVSLSGMDTIYAPQIRADFPELNLDELKQRAEHLAFSTLAAIDAANPALLSETSDLYADCLAQYLAGRQSAGRQEHYSDITIHRSVIADYRKGGGTCRIIFQLAVGARCRTTEEDTRNPEDRNGRTQFKMSLTALYVQDPSQPAAQGKTALAVNCPNCGAPVTSLGERQCSYCGSAIEPLNNRTWIFSDFTC